MRKTFLTSALDMPEIMSYIYNKSWKLQFSASSSIIIIEDFYLQTFLHSLEYVLSGDTSSKNIFFWLKLIIKILLFQYIRYIDGIYICILFIWIRIITLVSLLHLPTSVNYPQDIILHIPKAHPQPMK